MRMEMVFTRDEIPEIIPYQMICMTRYGSVWNTMRRKRRWIEEFSSYERERVNAMCRQTYNWTCTTGLPETLRMTSGTYDLWLRLAEFCASL